MALLITVSVLHYCVTIGDHFQCYWSLETFELIEAAAASLFQSSMYSNNDELDEKSYSFSH